MGKFLNSTFATEDPARFAALLERSEDDEGSLRILHEISDGLESAVISRFSPQAAARLLGQVPDATLVKWLESGPSRDGRRVLAMIAPERASSIIAGIGSSAKRRELRRLAAYPENSIGRLMQTDLVLLEHDDTVAEIDSQIQKHRGSFEGPIVIKNNKGEFEGILDPVLFLKDRGEQGTAADYCIRIEPVFADSPASLLQQHTRWTGQSSLPVVNYERKPIGYLTRSSLESAPKPADERFSPGNSLMVISRWYWSVLFRGLMFALSRRPGQ